MHPLLTSKQRQRIQTRHKASIERFGYQPQALFWSNKEIQILRFEMLSQMLPKNTSKPLAILDVGCGFGDLRSYLLEQGFNIDYFGIDLSEDMVKSAGFQYPGIQVTQGDIFDLQFAKNQFDYVLLSGALNEVVETDIEGTANQQGRYAKAVISEMARIARIGVAFNLLNAQNPKINIRPDLQSFYAEEIEAYCQSLATEVRLKDDYLDNDFTIYLTK